MSITQTSSRESAPPNDIASGGERRSVSLTGPSLRDALELAEREGVTVGEAVRRALAFRNAFMEEEDDGAMIAQLLPDGSLMKIKLRF